jgi:two-component system OmpR family sensor kinase
MSVARLSLRARLVLGVVVLALIGLVTADVVTYTSLRSFLLNRVDSTLETAHQGAEQSPGNRDSGGQPNGSSGVYVQVRSSSGKIISSSPVPHLPGTGEPSPPKLPATITVPQTPNSGPDRVTFLTVPSSDGGGRWRARASIDPGSTSMLIIATSLGEVDSTLHRLLVIELLVTAAVIAAIVLLGLWIVRLGLRPLSAITATADLITAGDLSRRVERAEPRTEVGRLGLALNTMLDRIEASDRRLRRFVADASHELRTPLAAVRAYAELFGRGADKRPDDLARAMTGISRESERMSTLVEDLLMLARLDEGQRLEREPVRLDEIAGEAVETARAVDQARPIELSAEPIVVLGDRAGLRHVIDNLLGNARSHTPPGTGIQVRVLADQGNGVIEVTDNGPGMTVDQVERVFERFYRADSSRSRSQESGGAGLGLSIVSAVTEALGGDVAVESRPGAGATFRVRLRLVSQG